MSLLGQVEVHHSGFELGMTHVMLNGMEIEAGFEQMGGIAVAQGMDANVTFGDSGALFRFAQSALDAASMHRFGGGWHALLVSSGGSRWDVGA